MSRRLMLMRCRPRNRKGRSQCVPLPLCICALMFSRACCISSLTTGVVFLFPPLSGHRAQRKQRVTVFCQIHLLRRPNWRLIRGGDYPREEDGHPWEIEVLIGRTAQPSCAVPAARPEEVPSPLRHLVSALAMSESTIVQT